MLRKILLVVVVLALGATGVFASEDAESSTATIADAVVADAELLVTGVATFGGTTPVVVANSGAPETEQIPHTELGLEIVEALVGQPDPDTGDLVLTLQLAELPEMGIVPELARYFWDFAVTRPNGRVAMMTYDGQASGLLVSARQGNPDMTMPRFVLEANCGEDAAGTTVCEPITMLDVDVDVDAATIAATVPLEVIAEQIGGDPVGQEYRPASLYQGISAAPSVSISPGSTSWILGTYNGRYTIAGKQVSVSLVDGAGETVATAAATLAEGGTFDAALPTDGLDLSGLTVVAEACFGDNCGQDARALG